MIELVFLAGGDVLGTGWGREFCALKGGHYLYGKRRRKQGEWGRVIVDDWGGGGLHLGLMMVFFLV